MLFFSVPHCGLISNGLRTITGPCTRGWDPWCIKRYKESSVCKNSYPFFYLFILFLCYLAFSWISHFLWLQRETWVSWKDPKLETLTLQLHGRDKLFTNMVCLLGFWCSTLTASHPTELTRCTGESEKREKKSSTTLHFNRQCPYDQLKIKWLQSSSGIVAGLFCFSLFL